MADKDLDALTADLKKAAVNTVALSVAQLAVKKVTDQLTATVGAFDKQVAKVVKDVEDLTSGMGAFNKESAQAAGNAKSMTEAFGGLLGVLTPLSAALKDVGDRLEGSTISIRQSSTALNVHNQTLTQLQSISIAAAQGQGAVSEAMGKTETAADKSAEKLKKVQETAKDLGGSMIDAFSALASGEEPMKVLTDKGGEMAKTMLKAKLDGVNLGDTFKSLGVATGLLKVTTAEAAAAQVVGAAAFDAVAVSAEGATVATGELAAAESVALAPLGAALVAIGVIAGGVAGVFALAANDISGDVGDLTKDMHLTEEQMGRVKDKSVTMGDVAKATFEALGDRLKTVFGPTFKMIGDGFMAVYHTVTDVSLKAVAFVVGAFAGAAGAIQVAWSVLPAAMGDIIISGVNFVLDGVGKMVNGAIGMANGMIGTVNWLAKKLGLSLQLPDLGEVQVAKLTNQFVGAAKSAGSAISAAFGNGFKGGFDGIMNIPGEIAGRAVDIAKDRIEEQAGKATDKIEQASAACACAKEPEDAVRRTNAAASAPRTAASVEPVSVVQEAPVEGIRPSVVNVEGLTTFVDPISKSLDALIEKLTDINALAPELSKQFEAAFGKTGKALGGVLTSFSAYSLEVAKIDRQAAGRTLTAEEQAKRDQARIKGYEAMAGAAKGFFKEGSDGYKAMQVAEIAFHTMETLNTIKSMALRGADTASTVAAEGPKQIAYAATAYAKTLGSLPFPLNLLAGAAVLAALVQVGAAIKGKPGGASVPGANDMKTRQETQGSGSVLGDSKAKSDSLEKALGYAEGYQNKDLEYGNAMVRSLKSIDDQIGAVAAALARSFGAGGMLSTEGLSLGKTGTSASLSNLGFSKSTTRTLQDQGIQFDAATLGAIVGGGLSGSTYQQVLETTKKKAFGITTSNKSKVITETGALDPDFLVQVTGLIELLGKGVGDAAKAIGSTDFEALLTNFKVDLGKLSFKDMTGAQIEEALNAIFGKLGDDMAKTAVPAIATFQKVGEGAFETLVRVARQYEVIDTTLKSVGMKFGEVGVASLEARERLVDLVGGLDNLTDQASFFGEHFLTEDERLKPVKDNVTERLTELKLPTDLSRDDFKKLVLGQNVATQGGAELYAALMDLAPAFDKVATAAENAKAAAEDKRSSVQDQIDDLTLSPAQKLAKAHDEEKKAAMALDASLGTLLDTLWDLQKAAKVDEKRKSIQDQIDDLTLSSAQLLAKSREAEMAAVKALDATLVPLVENLWKLQDAAQAAQLETDRSNMLASLWEAQGRTEEAKELRRRLALAQIKDPLQQLYQQQIWAAQDAVEKVVAARDVLTQAYQREKDAIQATKDKFKELSTSLRAFSASLTDTIAGSDPGTRYRRTRESFLSTAAMARLGDTDALGRLQSEGEAFTAASRDYVSTSLDYLHDVGLVRSAVDEAADTADRQVSVAQRQLEALDASVQGLIEINTNVVSVRQAIIALQAANAQARAAGVVSVGGIPIPETPTGPPVTVTPPPPPPAGNKTLDGLYNYDPFLGTIAYTESLRDPQYWTNGVNPYEKPGTQEYSLLETFKKKNPEKYAELNYVNTIQNYATGGSFEVGGSGPPDSKFFGLALSPGEAVNVQRADQKNDRALINELRNLRAELADLRASNARIATSNDKMERTLTNVTEGGRAMQTQAAA